jgi:hypothetical protein
VKDGMGLVRLSLDEVLSAVLVHLASGLDEDGPAHGRRDHATCLSGYTEWVSRSTPVITLGWDWYICPCQGPLLWRRLGTPRSNVMFVDEARIDVDWSRNLAMLVTLVDALPWGECTGQALALRYR